jgi:hypothetical protein
VNDLTRQFTPAEIETISQQRAKGQAEKYIAWMMGCEIEDLPPMMKPEPAPQKAK